MLDPVLAVAAVSVRCALGLVGGQENGKSQMVIASLRKTIFKITKNFMTS